MAITPTDFIRIAEAPIPEGGEAFYLDTVDGARLRVASFPASDPKGTILLLTGWSEFMEKYVEVVADLLARSFNVVTMDWRGQGLSSRLLPISEKGHLQSFGTHEADLKFVVENFVRQKFEGPLFLVAHSMGGAASLLVLAEGYNVFQGVVLSSPMTRIFPQMFKRVGVRLLSKAGVLFGASRISIPAVKEHARKFENNNLTHDKVRHTRYRKLLDAAPNAALRGPTFGWVNAATEAVDRINKKGALKGISVPVQIIAAGGDRTVDTSNATRLSCEYDMVETIQIKDALHEILMEADEYRDQFWMQFDQYIATRL